MSGRKHLYHEHTVPESSMPTLLLDKGLRKQTGLLAAGHSQVIEDPMAKGIVPFMKIGGTKIFPSSIEEKIVFF